MNDTIPHGWARSTVGDTVALIRNGTAATQITLPTPFPVTRIETISNGTIDWSRVGYLRRADPSYKLQRGDILYSHINSVAHMGKVALYDDERLLVHGMNLMLLRPATERIVPKFLHAVLASERGRNHARRECKSAVNQASLAQGDIKRLIFLLPPLPEQRAIGAVLDTLDNTITKTEQIVAKLHQMKRGLLQDLLARGIDDNGELRDPERHPEQFQDSPLGRIPNGWRVVTLRDHVATPVTYGVVQPGPDVEGGIPFVRGGDFPNGEIEIERLRTIGRTVDALYARTRLRGGEVLISLVGQPGASAVVPLSLAGANIARQAALIRPQPELDSHFLRAFISSDRGQRSLLGDTLGSVQLVVNLRDLRELRVPLPPVTEQKRIVGALLSAEARVQAERTSMAKLTCLRLGVSEDLLTGRVRVTPPTEVAA